MFKTSILFLIITFQATAQAPATTLPEFSFSRLNKKIFSNKDLENGKMLFFVFFDTDCDHCQHAVQYIGQHMQEFKKSAIYLITLDKPENIEIFMNKYGVALKKDKSVTILQDPNYEFMRKFKPRKYPSLFLYSANKQLIMYDDNEKNLFRFSQLINANSK